MNQQLKIAMVTPEAVPYAKTGGLADVLGVLPLEARKLGHEVILILPYYQMVRNKGIPVRKLDLKIFVSMGNEQVDGEIYTTIEKNGVTTYFIAKDEYFARKELYGTPKGDYSDNAYRFGFFCKGVLALLSKINFQSDIIHVNDWQSALIPYFLKNLKREKPFYRKIKTLLTIHNMAYQGLFPPRVLPGLGLNQDVFTQYGGIEFYGKVSFLKAGLITADAISTVSKKYSQEIQSEEYGCGLDGVFREQRSHVYGILNGVDYNQWNPEIDQFIEKRYTISDLSGKNECRKDLLKEFGLEGNTSIPIIGMISRLADQKGFDILAECIEELVKLDLRLVLLGTGEQKYHKLFIDIQRRYTGHLGIRIEFNNPLAHKIEAGSDMFLMPSRYEPCGLNQIYSLKYGTVPIVRATGGLDDTIENFNTLTGQGNGFKFQEYSSKALLDKIKEALGIFRNKELWQRLIQNGMQQDFSWSTSAQQYVELYNKTLNRNTNHTNERISRIKTKNFDKV